MIHYPVNPVNPCLPLCSGVKKIIPIRFIGILCLLAALILCWPDRLPAQRNDLQFERISLEEGLSQNTVYTILQDRKGFMWIGTQDGLNKYDGYDFKVYKHDPEDPHSLSNNVVRAIYEDSSGMLWIGTHGGGLCRMSRDERGKERFENFRHDPENPLSLGDNYVLAIYQDRAGVLWIGTQYGGLSRMAAGAGGEITFRQYRHHPADPNSLGHNYVMSICEDRSGNLWIGIFGGGFGKLDREKEIFIRYLPQSAYPGDDFVGKIYEDRLGMLWLATREGLSKFDRGKDTFTHYKSDPDDPNSLSGNSVWTIFEDREETLWIGAGNGLNKLDREKEIFIRYKNDPGDPYSLSDNYVRYIYEDRSGVLWIGTWNGGLNKFDRKRKKFPHFKNNPNSVNSLSHNNVRSIYEDRSGALWIGTRGGGLNRLFASEAQGSDRDKAVFTHFQNNPDDPNSLGNDYVWSILEDSRQPGTLWIGNYGGGLNKLVLKPGSGKGTFTRYQHDPDNPHSLSHNNVTAIHQDKTGTLWVGTDRKGFNKLVLSPGGTERGNRETENFIRYQHDPNNPRSLSSNEVWSIYEDRAGVLWIGTSGGGLNRFDRETETFTHYQHDPENPNSLSNDYIFSIYEDRSGALWIGTWGGGLNKFDRESVQFTHYREKDGLPNEVIYGILEDENGLPDGKAGNLWLSTNKGLSKFNPRDNTFKNYNVQDGLQSYEFNANAYYKSNSGEMFFGGINGFNAFYPGRVKDNPYVPPVVITAFKKFDTVIESDISQAGKFDLSYKDKYLSFEFVALDYTNPAKNQYAYIMEGFDESWIYCGTRRFASYTNLDPGDYVFRVKGSNNDGIWNEEGVSLKISIPPPPWKTWWAYALYILAIGAVIYAVRRNELNRIRLRNRLEHERMEAEKLKELDQMKSRFFANISHEFRTPLTLILGPIESAISKISNEPVQNQLRMAFQNGRRLLRLINQLLDLSKLEAGGMELKAGPGNLIAFLRGIVFTFESLAAQKQIALQFRSDYKLLEVYYDIEKLEQVFYNLMSNAIKFTPANSGGKISVSVVKTQVTFLRKLPPNIECVQIIIKDSGRGIPINRLPYIFDRFYQVDSPQTRNHEGTGIGLALAKEIVELHYGQISVSSEEGKGTKFVITLPLDRGHLKAEEVSDSSIADRGLQIADDTIGDLGLRIADLNDQNKSAIPNPQSEIILIVEDHPDVRAFIRQHLEADYQILEAVDGRNGFEKAAEAIPDLIISDVMMPEMDGYELCQALKNDQRTSHIPVILLTAKAGETSKLEGLQTGADDYLTKPFSSKELLARVKNLVEQRRKLRERFSREVVLKPAEIAITPMDEQFLNRVKDTVEKYLGDEEFSVEDLAAEAGLSRVQLHRKLKALTNQSAGEFILSLRLQRAADLITQNAGTVSEIAYMTGFSTPNYFAKCFRKQYGCSPSEYKMKITE